MSEASPSGRTPSPRPEYTPDTSGAATAGQPPVADSTEGWLRGIVPGLAAVCLLGAGEGVFLVAYHPPGRQPAATIILLLGSAILALLVGTLALAAGPRVGLSTIRRKMVFSASIGVVFTFGDALFTARLMFVSPEDVSVLIELLLFALLISLMLVLSLAGMMHQAVVTLTRAARRMASGQLDTIVPVESGDELAVLADDLEDMGASLAEARRMQRVLEDARRDLITGISHDLRTPLNALQAVASALADGLVSEEPATVTHYLRELDMQVARLAAMVDDLFTLARLEGPAPDLDRAPYAASDLLSNVLERAEPLAREAAIRLEVTVYPGTPAVLVDVRQIERVLDNLVRNALHYTASGELITVEAAPYPDAPATVLITVCDTGTGISTTDLPLLFDRYYRGGGQRRGADGSGLGLAIVKAVVQAHGGRVWAISPPPGIARGTLISLVLPAASDPMVGEPAEDPHL